MVPKYIGIDPNIGGLYSMVSEITGSLTLLSNYMSLYHELWRYKGEPAAVNKTVNFSLPTVWALMRHCKLKNNNKFFLN